MTKKLMIIITAVLISGCSHKMENKNMENFNFECPASPNCVSSLASNDSSKIEAIKFQGTGKQSLDSLETIIKKMKRASIITRTDTKIHAVFTSFLFRFKDDVFIELDEAEKIINIKSASRVGYSDFGVNKKRVERIKELYSGNKKRP